MRTPAVSPRREPQDSTSGRAAARRPITQSVTPAARRQRRRPAIIIPPPHQAPAERTAPRPEPERPDPAPAPAPAPSLRRVPPPARRRAVRPPPAASRLPLVQRLRRRQRRDGGIHDRHSRYLATGDAGPDHLRDQSGSTHPGRNQPEAVRLRRPGPRGQAAAAPGDPAGSVPRLRAAWASCRGPSRARPTPSGSTAGGGRPAAGCPSSISWSGSIPVRASSRTH